MFLNRPAEDRFTLTNLRHALTACFCSPKLTYARSALNSVLVQHAVVTDTNKVKLQQNEPAKPAHF